MIQRTTFDKRSILYAVLLDVSAISKAPRSIMDFQGAQGLRGEALEQFEDKKRAEEAGKVYKAVDEHGNVYLVKNPWIWSTVYQGQRVTGAIYEKPVLKYTYEEALVAARGPRETKSDPTTMRY